MTITDARLKELMALAEKATQGDYVAGVAQQAKFLNAANPATVISMAQALLEMREALRRYILEVPYHEPTGNGVGTKCYACNVVSLGEPSPKAHTSTCWAQQALKGTS